MTTTTTEPETPAPKRRGRPARAAVETAVVPPPPLPFVATEMNDDEDDGEEDTEVHTAQASVAPPLSFAAASAEVRARQTNEYLKVEDDLEDMMEGLEFGEGKHEVRLSRQRTRNSAGVLTATTGASNYLDAFRRKVSVAEIKDLYGGGEFLYTVWGPNPAGKRTLKNRRMLSIEGESLYNGKPLMSATAVDSGLGMAKDLMKAAIDAKEREAERLREDLKDMKKSLAENAGKDTTAPLIALMREQEVQRLAHEKERADREETRRKEERDERNRELLRLEGIAAAARLEAEKRAEQEKSRAESGAMNIVAMMKQNTDVLVASFKESMSSKEQQHATVLAVVQGQAATQFQMMQTNTQQQMEMMRAQMQHMLDQTQSLSAAREKILSDALTAAKSEKKGGIKEMVQEFAQLKTGMDTIMGVTGSNTSGGIFESVKEVMREPGFGEAVRAFVAPRIMGQLPQQQQPQPGQPTAVGVVQVSGPRPAAQVKGKGPSPWPTTSGAPPQPKPAAKPAAKPRVVAATPPIPAAGPAPVLTVAVEPPAPDAGSIGVVFPSAEAPLPEKLQALVTALDVAIRADWPAAHIWTSIVSKYPADVLTALKDARLEGCMQVVEQYAPQSVINTAMGVAIMRDLFEMLERT